MMGITELAPAKLNLTLDVGARRPDGYHDITSIMQSAALYDVVALDFSEEGGIAIECPGTDLPTGPDNLAWKAADVFFRETNIPRTGISIRLEKKIPSQAGLGGGSSDAAAVLWGMHRLFHADVSDESLEAMAARVGSDVPYCIRGGTALAQGRGERLTVLPKLPMCWFVIVKPPVANSTAAMYRKLDEISISERPDSDKMVDALKNGDLAQICRLVGNVFEQALPPDSEVFAICRQLSELGADAACMTGSGSAVMGLFCQEETARLAARELQKAYPLTFFAPRL